MGQETVLEPFECFYMMIRGLILKYIPHPRKNQRSPWQENLSKTI